MTTIDRASYARMFGPTTGDRIRLADSDLFVEVEYDHAVPGYELLGGAASRCATARAIGRLRRMSDGALDYVIVNAVIVDAVTGIIKADIGIRDGRIVGIGKAGNPTSCRASPRAWWSAPPRPRSRRGHDRHRGRHRDARPPDLAPADRARAVDGHDHADRRVAGPSFEVATGGPRNLALFLKAGEYSPMNYVPFGRGSSDPAAVLEMVAAGAGAVKIHEDFGASPAIVDKTLVAADSADFAVHLHTDSINEFGFSETTMATIGDRTIHLYHVEGAGGGHAPDLIRCVSYDNVIPGTTNPTNPYTLGGLDEGVPMTMLAHLMNWQAPEDVAFAEARIRPRRWWPRTSCTTWARSPSSAATPRAWAASPRTSPTAGNSRR